MGFWVIDRWEEGLAICHNVQGNRQEIPKERFPEGMKEGDYFLITENGDIIFSSEETKMRRISAKNLRKRLLLR